MKHNVSVLFFVISLWCYAHNQLWAQKPLSISKQVDSLIKKMTLSEKVGQLTQYKQRITGVHGSPISATLYVKGVAETKKYQSEALQSRLKIPMLFGYDVIHGYRTTFPIPMAEACSWDIEAIQQASRIAATEAAAGGIHWVFAPMVDIAQDPGWGRVMEGSGEDPYLGSLIAAARVKGFQGKGLGDTTAVMACVKHFAAYGGALGGRDYDGVDMSMNQLWNVYLRPYKAAVDAGAATLMNSFNDLNGIPAAGSKYLQTTVLRDTWKFKGFVVSDWDAVAELTNHGFAEDTMHAVRIALNAGCDMDMQCGSYDKYLEKIAKQGKMATSVIDEAVRRVLTKKFELGLFADPYKFSNEQREQAQKNNPQHMAFAREMAKKSIVLLKNNNQTLPLSKTTQRIAFIGPLVKDTLNNLGNWIVGWADDGNRVVTQWQGFLNKIDTNTVKLIYAKGCNIDDDDTSGFASAIAAAKNADVVVISVGENRWMSGEAASRASLQLPGVQEQLIKAVYAAGKPIVLLVNAGRPLIFNWAAEHVQSIVYTWWLGHQAGNAIADVLFGDYNPSGRLAISFPRAEGQIPVFYNHARGGRPAVEDLNGDSTKFGLAIGYIDLESGAKYPFGYGLSYTKFTYSDIHLSHTQLKGNQTLQATIMVTNAGDFDGEETVQLYIRDKVASVVRPVKELIGFKKVFLKKGSSQTLTFTITTNDLKFYNENLAYVWEPGTFEIMIGANAYDVQRKTINWQR